MKQLGQLRHHPRAFEKGHRYRDATIPITVHVTRSAGRYLGGIPQTVIWTNAAVLKFGDCESAMSVRRST